MNLYIPDEEVPAFTIYIALGVLRAIYDGLIPESVGIWTIGSPGFWLELEKNNTVSQDIIDVLKMSDELTAIKALLPEHFNDELIKLISQLQMQLSQMPDKHWRSRWDNSSEEK